MDRRTFLTAIFGSAAAARVLGAQVLETSRARATRVAHAEIESAAEAGRAIRARALVLKLDGREVCEVTAIQVPKLQRSWITCESAIHGEFTVPGLSSFSDFEARGTHVNFEWLTEAGLRGNPVEVDVDFYGDSVKFKGYVLRVDRYQSVDALEECAICIRPTGAPVWEA